MTHSEVDNTVHGGEVEPILSLVMPMYNEEALIEETLLSLSASLDGIGEPWEIVLVDDGSVDGSMAIAGRVARAESRIRLVSYPANRGRGYALRQGFARARGSYIISTESDLSWGPGIVRELYRVLAEGRHDIVIATPYLPGGGFENVPYHRRLLSTIGNRILSFSLGGAVTMASGMTRGYRREVLDSLDLESDDKEIHLEILSKALALGFRVAEVPARLAWKESPGTGRPRRSSFKLWRFVTSHLLFSFEEYPLLLFGSMGGVLFVTGTAFGLHALRMSITGHPVGNRPIVLGSLLLILFGLQIMVFSFLSLQNTKLTRRIVRLTALVKRLTK